MSPVPRSALAAASSVIDAGRVRLRDAGSSRTVPTALTTTLAKGSPMATTGGAASFDHESHLPEQRWPRLVEAGAPVAGWVRRGTQVKAVNNFGTLMTYSRVPTDAPSVPGSSWTNLDLCGGWWRPWRDRSGSSVREDDVTVERVLAGEKLCGEIIADSSGLNPFMPSPDDVRALVGRAAGFELRVRPFESDHWTDRWRCWLAPSVMLGEVVDLDQVASFFRRAGVDSEIAAIRGAAQLWLPAVEDFDVTLSAAVRGLVLGYPPASAVSLLHRR